MAISTNGGPTGSAAARRGAAAHGPGAVRQGSLVRESERAALAGRRTSQPQINVSVNVTANPVSDTDFEVELKLEGKAETAGTVLFSIELVFAGVFRIQNVPQEHLHPLMMIECPRLLFPFAREIIATVGAQRRLPAAAARSDRFRRALSAAAWPAGAATPRRRHESHGRVRPSACRADVIRPPACRRPARIGRTT